MGSAAAFLRPPFGTGQTTALRRLMQTERFLSADPPPRSRTDLRKPPPGRAAALYVTSSLGRQAKLKNKRILVVEDEALVSMLVEDELRDAGAEILGPAASVSDALPATRSGWSKRRWPTAGWAPPCST